MDEIERIAKKHGLKVIYDAAHAFGVEREGVSAANFGDASMFSFHATKVFNTIEGGALCFNDVSMKQRVNDLKNFGIHGPEDVLYVGGNAKMNEFCAAMGLCNLRHIEGWIMERKAVVERYRQRLGGTPGIRLCAEQPGVKSNYAYFPVLFEDYKYTRDQVFGRLADNNIIARKYFYPITNSFECYKGRPGFDPDMTPVAKYVGERVLTLPLYAGLSLADADRICDVILG
ncbi:MAG: DegT/DnrJ/EryC1/StrS family aminotransferase [Fibrobacter sp.]|nr:DegT/DnrJ/EryC1/StrS family aminotransferase [Fibrobacter sp.]